MPVKRNCINNDTYSLGYAMGLIYGYDGRLADIEKIPFRNTFLFNGPVSPLGGMFASYHLNEGFSLNFSVQPLVVLYGFEVRF